MSRLTNDQYVAELNRRLQLEPGHRPDTHFVTIPREAQEAARGGSTWVGPDNMLPTVLRVVKDAAGQFEVEHPFVAERG
jgi:hypothetical protein